MFLAARGMTSLMRVKKLLSTPCLHRQARMTKVRIPRATTALHGTGGTPASEGRFGGCRRPWWAYVFFSPGSGCLVVYITRLQLAASLPRWNHACQVAEFHGQTARRFAHCSRFYHRRFALSFITRAARNNPFTPISISLARAVTWPRDRESHFLLA